MRKENETMTKCIVYFNDCDNYVNLEADYMQETEKFIKVFYGKEMVGMFAIDNIKAIYKTTK